MVCGVEQCLAADLCRKDQKYWSQPDEDDQMCNGRPQPLSLFYARDSRFCVCMYLDDWREDLLQRTQIVYLFYTLFPYVSVCVFHFGSFLLSTAVAAAEAEEDKWRWPM